MQICGILYLLRSFLDLKGAKTIKNICNRQVQQLNFKTSSLIVFHAYSQHANVNGLGDTNAHLTFFFDPYMRK